MIAILSSVFWYIIPFLRYWIPITPINVTETLSFFATLTSIEILSFIDTLVSCDILFILNTFQLDEILNHSNYIFYVWKLFTTDSLASCNFIHDIDSLSQYIQHFLNDYTYSTRFSHLTIYKDKTHSSFLKYWQATTTLSTQWLTSTLRHINEARYTYHLKHTYIHWNPILS